MYLKRVFESWMPIFKLRKTLYIVNLCHIYDRHVSRQLARTQAEAADKFMVRLGKQARHCKLAKLLNGSQSPKVGSLT